MKYIPLSSAFSLILSQGIISAAVTYKILEKQEEKCKAVLADRDRAIKILQETSNFLLDHADLETVDELDRRLDFWRAALEIPVERPYS